MTGDAENMLNEKNGMLFGVIGNQPSYLIDPIHLREQDSRSVLSSRCECFASTSCVERLRSLNVADLGM